VPTRYILPGSRSLIRPGADNRFKYTIGSEEVKRLFESGRHRAEKGAHAPTPPSSGLTSPRQAVY